MTLNDLFTVTGIDPKGVLGPNVERAMKASKLVASFIRHEAGRALFVSLYEIGASTPLTREQFWQVPAHVEMRDKFGLAGFTDETKRGPSVLSFELTPTDFYAEWKGKLIVGWPPPERSWWRRAHRNEFRVLAVLEDSALDAAMPPWDDITLTWEELSVLPTRWKAALAQWRGIYYIHDVSDGKSYVGSAYGHENILGRWLGYATSGHGGNSLLRQRDHRNFRFSILQRVSPDMEAVDVIRLEATWKARLHTAAPSGLNEN
jgi:hypothetical protein